MMKTIILKFVGGYWDGRKLRSDSSDQEESLLASACYEMTHHGAIGGNCPGLSDDAVTFARVHGWATPENGALHGAHRYLVTARSETEAAVIVTFHHAQAGEPAGAGRAEATHSP